MSDESDQSDEIMALRSIFEHDAFECDVLQKPYSGKVVVNLPSDSGPYDILCRDTIISLKYLSPILLEYTLPQDYPSSNPPAFTLSCLWLTSEQLEILSNRLNDLWTECGNGAVLFTWISFLQDEALDHLNVRFPIQPSEEDVEKLIHHSMRRINEEFDKGFHECPVCFCEKSGSECVRLEVCSHIICKECLTGFLSVHITEGNMKALDCPMEKCNSQIHPSVIKSLASEKDFERYERLLLERTLDTMSDVQYCPRPTCVKPVVVEEKDGMGLCHACNLAFCVHCRLTYHGVQKCKAGETADLRKLRDTRDLYVTGSNEDRKRLERMHGKKKLKAILDECESAEWLHTNSKKCPNCSTCIEKTDGCNRMVCSGCRANFCWLCLEMLNSNDPYGHYSNKKSPCYQRCLEGVEDE